MSRGKLYSKAREVAAAGRYGDTMLAHITPREAAILKGLGGTGIVNPATGLPEFNEGSDQADSHGSSSTGAVGVSDPGSGTVGAVGGVTTPGEQLADALAQGARVDFSTPAIGTDPFEAMFAPTPGPPAIPSYAEQAGLLGRVGDRIAAGFRDALDRPVETAINTLVGFTPFGLPNTLANLTTGFSAGRAATAAGRGIADALGFNQTASANTQTVSNTTPTGPQDTGLNNDTRAGGDAYSSAINTLNEIANPKPPEDPTKGILIRNRTYNNPPPMTLANYGQQGEFQFFTPGDVAIPRFAQGGVVGMADGGFVVPADVVSGLGDGSTKAGHRRLGLGKLLEGPGTGMSDDIPAHIDGVTPARVADGEVYLSPQEVELVGGGDHKKGLARMYALMKDVRKKRTGKTSQPKPLDGGMAGGGPVTTGNSQWNFLTPQSLGNNPTGELATDVSRIQQTLAGLGQVPMQTFADGGVTQLPGGGQNIIPGINVGYAQAIAPNDPQQQQVISGLNPSMQAGMFDIEQKAGRAGWNMGTIWDTKPKFEIPPVPTYTPTPLTQIGPPAGGYTDPNNYVPSPNLVTSPGSGGGGNTSPQPPVAPPAPQPGYTWNIASMPTSMAQNSKLGSAAEVDAIYRQYVGFGAPEGVADRWLSVGGTKEGLQYALANSEAFNKNLTMAPGRDNPMVWDPLNNMPRAPGPGIGAWVTPT